MLTRNEIEERNRQRIIALYSVAHPHTSFQGFPSFRSFVPDRPSPLPVQPSIRSLSQSQIWMATGNAIPSVPGTAGGTSNVVLQRAAQNWLSSSDYCSILQNPTAYGLTVLPANSSPPATRNGGHPPPSGSLFVIEERDWSRRWRLGDGFKPANPGGSANEYVWWWWWWWCTLSSI
jgi:hypothetical protein